MTETCSWMIEGPESGTGRVKVWWRRRCKRAATHGDRCWQHARPGTTPDTGRNP